MKVYDIATMMAVIGWLLFGIKLVEIAPKAEACDITNCTEQVQKVQNVKQSQESEL